MKKVLLIAGTRPEVIKLLPVYKALKATAGFNSLFMTTGQHGPTMIDPILDFFEVKVDVAIQIETQSQSLNVFSASLLRALDQEIVKHRPDLVVVQGDTTSCVMGSLAAFYRGVKIAHVEAGLRTYNRRSPYPEEINRRITALLANFHFAPTELAYDNLRREKVEGIIEIVGNTVIDSLAEACQRIAKIRHVYEEKFGFLTSGFEKLILITGHRRENIGAHFEEIYRAILRIASYNLRYSFVYLQHSNPDVRRLASDRLKDVSNVFLIEPLPYDEMVFLIQQSYIVMTDSGGLQEECPSLNKPVMVLRETTERPEAIDAGCNVLAGVTEEKIVSIFERLVQDHKLYRAMSEAENPFGDGLSSIKIVQYLEKHLVE